MPLPATFSPIQANYFLGGQLPVQEQAIIGGLMLLAAGAMTGVGLFYTYPAAATLPPAITSTSITYGSGITVGTATFVNSGEVALTAAQMVELSQLTAGNLAFSEGAVVAILESWGLTALSLDGILALALFDVNVGNLPWHYGNFGAYLGGNGAPGFGGGFSTPPGFPGFGATTVYGRGQRVCYTVESNGGIDTVCFYEY